jgi:hypothetical protein
MHRTFLANALLLSLAAGCSSSVSSSANATLPAPAPPAVQAGAVDATSTAVEAGAAVARMTITQEGAPQLAAPTTARVAQSGDAATRCARLAGLCLEDVGRMMSFLGATAEQSRVALDRLRPAYGDRFVGRCATATPEMLTCVETAENAFTGLARCGLNRGRAFSDVLVLGEGASHEVRWRADERAVTDAAGAAALRAAMVGSWDRRDAGTWTFTAEGVATKTSRLGGTERVDRWQFAATSRARLASEPLGFWSAVVDGDLLYLNGTSGGTGYAEAQPIAEDGTSIAVSFGLWAIQDIHGTPRCTGFSWWGQPVESARCAWEGQGDARRLLIMASYGHDLLSGEPAPPSPVRLREMAGHLVGNNDFHFFQRVRPSGAAPTR